MMFSHKQHYVYWHQIPSTSLSRKILLQFFTQPYIITLNNLTSGCYHIPDSLLLPNYFTYWLANCWLPSTPKKTPSNSSIFCLLNCCLSMCWHPPFAHSTFSFLSALSKVMIKCILELQADYQHNPLYTLLVNAIRTIPIVLKHDIPAQKLYWLFPNIYPLLLHHSIYEFAKCKCCIHLAVVCHICPETHFRGCCHICHGYWGRGYYPSS